MRIVLVTSGIVLLLTCVAFFIYELFAFRENARDHLTTLAKIVADNSAGSIAFDNPEDAKEVLHALKAEKHIVAGALYDKAGNLFVTYPEKPVRITFPKPPFEKGYKYVGGYLEGFQEVRQGDVRIGSLYLKSDTKAIYHRFYQYTSIALLVFIVSIFVAYLISLRLQKIISKPILALADTAGKVSEENDYTVRAKRYDNDELGQLTDAFNQMLTQIEKQNYEITLFNHELEEKVYERTNELAQVNNELKLKSDFVETIIDSSVDVIAVFDKQLRYVLLNKYGEEVFGVKEKDVIGKNILDVFPQIEDGAMYKDLVKSLKGEFVHNSKYQSRISHLILENFFIPLLDKDGKIYNVLVIGHDITEIQKANEKLQVLNTELEKSNRDLEQFAFVASHDLQEPLRKIQTFSNLLETDFQNDGSKQKYLSKIISSAARMTDLIRAVLNYSRLSNEKAQFKEVDLNEVVENIKTDLELIINEKNAVIHADPLPVVVGNELQLQQLFLNLVSNSLKFSSKQPVIKISSSIVSAKNADESDGIIGTSDFAELLFIDNGIGFEQHYANKIFTVFQRLHNKQEYAGTGIGLALCKKIIENHKGQISVTSAPNVGTTFKIRLPMEAVTV